MTTETRTEHKERATPGPWEAVNQHDRDRYTIRDPLGRIVASTPGSAGTTDQRPGSPERAIQNRLNAELLAQAPALEARCERLLAALERLEWSDYAACEGKYMGDPHPLHPRGHPACPACGGLTHDGEASDRCFREEAYGHKRDCWLRQAIAEARLPERGQAKEA